MLLIPAVALKDGKCGVAGAVPGAGSDPAEALQSATAWAAAGVKRLHFADGDAAMPGRRGLDMIHALAEACPDVAIQVAADFRDGDAVALYLGAGAEYVVLDARAAGVGHFINDLCYEYPGHVLMTLESRNTLAGRSRFARHPLEETARRVQQEGVAGIIYRTVADANGIVDVAPAVELAAALTIPVQLAAKLLSLEALRRVCAQADGIAGVILDTGYRSAPSEFAVAIELAERAQAGE